MSQVCNLTVYATLKNYFGFDRFRFCQQEVIETVLSGRDAFAVMPTGAGKSLCFQIPALMLPGTAVVFSPLISLMKDQVGRLRSRGISAAFINSSQTFEERDAVVRKLKEGSLTFLYLAPESLASGFIKKLLCSLDISLIAIDEAHCLSIWGHDFRPDYEHLCNLKRLFPKTPIVAVTATADLETRMEVSEKLLRMPRIFVSSPDRRNFKYKATRKLCKPQMVLDFIQFRHLQDSGIVFTGSREKAENLARFLQDAGVNALPYHAGLSSEVREENQRRFNDDPCAVMVATVAFGMGIDKPDVRFVVHTYLPKSLESYIQEIGRAGRDGEAAEIWLCCTRSEAYIQRQRILGAESEDWFKNQNLTKLEAMQAYLEASECRRSLLLQYFGELGSNDCGRCDNCELKSKDWDATEAGKKFLSAIWRVNQKFGMRLPASEIISILLGEETPQNMGLGFSSLSTWKIGCELDKKKWRQLYRYFCLVRLIDVLPFEDNALALNSRSLLFLRSNSWKIRLSAG